jgi:adenylate cyclase
MTQINHRLAAIVSADVAGYSRLMAEDEVSTVRLLTAYRSEITRMVEETDGRVVDFIGDNMLAEFKSAVRAVSCAAAIQEALDAHNEKIDENRRMLFRMGIHLGDVMIDDGRIYGDGVNIAARLQGIADPGGVCVSDIVYQQVRNKLDIGFRSIGERILKNIPDPVRVHLAVLPFRRSGSEAGAGLRLPGKDNNLTPPDMPSLAVLPFVNLSDDPEQEYFCSGLTMDIMNSLVRIPGLFLISDSSIFTFSQQPVSIREAGERLGVRYVLEGGTRKSGNRVRISAQLTEARTGRRIWGERFDRTLDDLFSVQDEITEEIVTALDIRLVSGEWARVLRRHIRNRDALESYYRGWQSFMKGSPDEIREAQHMMEEVVRLEPESPVGYALAAWSHWWGVYKGVADEKTRMLTRARHYAEEALRLGDVTGLPHLVLAHIHLLDGKLEQSLAEAEQSVLSRPSCDASYAAKANILNYLGKTDEAIGLAKHAMRLAPIYPSFYPVVLASAYFSSRQYRNAVSAAEDVLSRDRNNVDALVVLAGGHAALGNDAEARQAVRELLDLEPDFSLEKYVASQPYRNTATRRHLLEQLKKAGLV